MIISLNREIIRQRLKASLQALMIIGAVLFLDQISKYLVYKFIVPINYRDYIYPYGGIGVFSNFMGIEFSINHITNKGAAWGFFGNYQLHLVILRLALIVGTLVYLSFYNTRSSWRIPLLLIVGGAIGNVTDFFTYGQVIDMFHFVLWGYDFPIFNVADSAISIGIVSLFALSWFEP